MRRLLILLVLMLTPSVCFAQANARMLAGINAQTGTSYTIVPADQIKLLTFNNPNPVAVTLPAAGSNPNFGAGALFSVRNLGAGVVTITVGSGTIDGGASITLNQNQGADIYSDGANYTSQKGTGSGLFGTSDPSGACANGSNYTNTTTGKFFICQAGIWAPPPGGGGGPPGGVNHDTQCNASGSFGACSLNPKVMYVTTSGNDANSGKSWDNAKFTISGACAALPSGNANCTAGQGVIYITANTPTYTLPTGSSPLIQLVALSAGEANGLVSGPLPYIDCRAFGCNTNASGDTASFSATTTTGSPTVTINANTDFIVGDGLVIPFAGAATTQTTPAAPSVGPKTANGSTSISYKCVGVDKNWGLTAASAAGTTTVAPTVFGQGAVGVSAATWAANVVSITTTSAMPFSSGTFHAMIPGLVSGGNQIGGIRLVTVTSSTTLTYSLTGSGSIPTPGAARVLFVNGFDITQISETAGSNQVVITTDVNHNFFFGTPNVTPISEIFIDGTSFPNEDAPGYANGVYTITSTTANTITITTPYTAKFTQNGVANINLSTANMALMTVLTYAQVQVNCPANTDGSPATGGVYYAVYANYGSGYAPVGFTQWDHSIFFDFGPAYSQNLFTPPPAMALPTTPPAAAQNQVFEGQIIGIAGTTLTLDRNVPTGVSSSGYHSNGAALLKALNMSCQRSDGVTNVAYYPVLIPAQANFNYWFNAPIDMGTTPNSCQKSNVVQAGNVRMNGTVTNSLQNPVTWQSPKDLGSGWFDSGMGGGRALLQGFGSPMLATWPGGVKWHIRGIDFITQSSGQNAFVNLVEHTDIKDCNFHANNATTSTPLIIGGGGFQVILDTIDFGTIPNPFTPTAAACVPCGWSSYWPVPTIQIEPGPSNIPAVEWRGENYGNSTALRIDMGYPGQVSIPQHVVIEDIQTYQGGYQPIVTLSTWPQTFGAIELRRTQFDSTIMPSIANLDSNVLAVVNVELAGTAGTGVPNLTGYPAAAVQTFGSSQVQGGINELNIQRGGIEAMGVTQNTAADPFNRASLNTGGPCLSGSCWNTINNAMSISGNQLTTGACALNMLCGVAWNGNTFSPNQTSAGVVPAVGSGGGSLFPMVRYNAALNEAYVCSNGAIQIANFNNSTFPTTVATGTAFSNGDFVWCEANGVNITVYDVTQGFTYSGTDSTIPNGVPGVASFSNNTSSFDNWMGGGLHPIEQGDAEIERRQSLHVPSLTVGSPVPIAGALPFAGLFDSTWAISSALCTDTTGKAVTSGCAGGSITGLTAGQVAIAGSASSITSSKPLQGTDTSVLTSSTVAAGTGNPLCTDTGSGATTTGCPNLSGLTSGQIPVAGSAITVTSSKAQQGTDTSILTSGTVSGTGATLCTDANGGATTVGCTGGSISGLTAGGVAIAGTATTITSSKPQQGTDANILTSGTISANTPALLCTDANSGATTANCSVYNTQSTATNSNIAAVTMVASAPANTMYMYMWTVSLTAAGTNCTSTTSVVLNVIFTDPNGAGSQTESLGQISIAPGGNGTLGFVAQGVDNVYAKSGTAVQYSTSGYTPGTGCTVNPSYQVTMRLIPIS